MCFGGTAATGATIISSTSITATTPAHAAGAMNVVVANTDGKSGTLSGGYTYSAVIPPPNATSITPNTGPTSGGAAVTITEQDSNRSNGIYRRDRRRGSHGGRQHVDHGDDTGSRDGCGKLVVANPDGQSDKLANAYTYVTYRQP